MAPSLYERVRQQFRRLFARTSADEPARSRIGRMGEQVATRHLKDKGYRILQRNYRIKQGEIDIVAFRDGLLAFVEVRSQGKPGPIDPALSITRRKQWRVVKAAQHYMSTHRPEGSGVSVRFDVITVRFDPEGGQPQIRHIEGAFHTTPKGFT